MRDAREWASIINDEDSLAEYPTMYALVRSIQSDAARSERERAARVCEERITGEEECDEEAAACARLIRALPDVGADGREA